MKYFFPLLALVVFVSSCKKIRYDVAATQQVQLNVAYGSDPRQKMDVYLPKDRTSATKVIILLHGGAFVAGDKQEFSNQALALTARGYAVINVNYRLVDGEGLVTLPASHKASAVKVADQINDIRAAMDLVTSNAKKYVISGTKWAFAGHSAGGTLALLYTFSGKNADGRIKAVANWAGVTDFSYEDEAVFQFFDPALRELYYRLVGAEPTNANKNAFKDISPVWLVPQVEKIPVLNIRPEFNSILGMPDISAPQYTAFVDALTSKNIPNLFKEIKGADHGFNGNWSPVLEATVSYFDEKL